MSELTTPERAALLSKAWELERGLYPDDRTQMPTGRDAALLRESYYLILGEYADRLPRIVMSVCPHTGQPLKKSFDRWGVDGPWWHKDREVELDEPTPPSTFKVLLGALALHQRTPVEARAPVIPGPEVPFVVPRLLGLPGMVAVISRLEMETGDIAYPIAYFSTVEIPHARLHQFWLQEDYWFDTPEGESAWLIANDVWDFNLEPWIRSGQLHWTEGQGPEIRVVDGRKGEPCPFLNLPGDQQPQSLGFGKRELLDLPDGTPVNPFEE
ncbi:MAG TPA: hypothetical protein VNT99_20830 [Methylomirabilota bacterium]|nr:hypothetical protein [Methylomirabilota bacterium]